MGVTRCLGRCCCLLVMLPSVVCVLAVTNRPTGLVNLQQDRLSPQYKSRLVHAASLFSKFCTSTNRDHQSVWESAMCANEALIAYAQFCFDARRPLWVVSHAILALQTSNRLLKGSLRPAWDSVQSWKLSTPVKSRTPLPHALMKAVCYHAVCNAIWHDSSHAYMWFCFAVCIRLGFHGLMRPNELFSMTRRYLKLPMGTLLGGAHVAVATIREPKNRAFMGRLQVRMVRDNAAIAWLTWLCAGMIPDAFLWPLSDYCFRTCLKTCLLDLGLGHLDITPGSLRAGGATWLLENGVSLSAIRFAGSWASDKSMCCYLQEAESASVLLSISPTEQSRLETLLQDLGTFERPPRTPFLEFCYGSAGSL